MSEIEVEREVIDYVIQNGKDFRLSTSCYGPVIVPVEVKPPKGTDLRIMIGERILYVSRVQARYVQRITRSMLYDRSYLRSCSVFRD